MDAFMLCNFLVLPEGKTALIHAAINDRPEVTGALLNAGASTVVVDDLGHGALWYALEDKCWHTAALLLQSVNQNLEKKLKETEAKLEAHISANSSIL